MNRIVLMMVALVALYVSAREYSAFEQTLPGAR